MPERQACRSGVQGAAPTAAACVEGYIIANWHLAGLCFTCSAQLAANKWGNRFGHWILFELTFGFVQAVANDFRNLGTRHWDLTNILAATYSRPTFCLNQ